MESNYKDGYSDAPTGLPIDAENGLALVKDDADQPLIFSVGSDHNLYVIAQSSAGGAWEQINLTEQFDRRSTVQAFEVVQDRKGRIWIALALAACNEQAGELHIAGPLSNKAGAITWGSATQYFSPRKQQIGDLEIVGIHLESGSARTPLLVAQGKKVGSIGRVDHYLVVADNAQINPEWREIQLPNDIDDLLDVTYGWHKGLEGLWALYTVGNDRVLEFTSVIDPEFLTSIHVKYEDPPPDLARISAIPNPKNRKNSDLFVAGDGVYVYLAVEESAYTDIASATQQPGVKDLIVQRSTEATSVWCTGAAGSLEKFTWPNDVSSPWSGPTKVGQQAQRFAVTAGSEADAVDLAVITSSQTLEYWTGVGIANSNCESIPLQKVWNVKPLTREELDMVIKKYAPLIHYYKGEFGEEKYLPCSVEWLLSRCGLWDVNNGRWQIAPGALWDDETRDIARSVPVANSPDDERFCVRIPPENADVIRAGNIKEARIYANAKFLPSKDCTDVQYHFCFGYNGPGTFMLRTELHDNDEIDLAPMGEHEGDWEHITVRVDNCSKAIRKIYFSQHDSGEWVKAEATNEAEPFERTASGQPLIYASRNGHASYPHAGPNFTSEDEAEELGVLLYHIGLRNDTSAGGLILDGSKCTKLISARFIDDQLLKPKEPAWLTFPYRWGLIEDVSVKETVDNILPQIVAELGITGAVLAVLAPWLLVVVAAALYPATLEIADKKIPESERTAKGPGGLMAKNNWWGNE